MWFLRLFSVLSLFFPFPGFSAEWVLENSKVPVYLDVGCRPSESECYNSCEDHHYLAWHDVNCSSGEVRCYCQQILDEPEPITY